nr:unnamed protein product [Callosobruchus chinensis]
MEQPLKLSGENWVTWKFQTTVILRGRGLLEIVTGEKLKPTGDEAEKWCKDDAKAQEIIVARLENGPITHILSCETSKDMWSKLKSVYDKESVVSVHLLQQEFFMMNFNNSDSVSTYISQLEELKSKLKQAGEELSEKMVITKILMSLPEKFKHFRSAWESVPVEKQSLEELTSRLLIEEERRTSSVSDKTPFEVWYKKSADLNQLKTFGSRVSVHVPKQTRLKWDAKNQDGIFMGYGENVKGYRIYIPLKNKIEFHRDVIFLLNKLPSSKIKQEESAVETDIAENDEEEALENVDSEPEAENSREESETVHGDETDSLSGRKITVVVDGFSSSFHNTNAGVPQGSVLAPTLFLLHTIDLISSTTNPIHSFADDSTLHAGIMSNRPISVVELECRRLATAASLSKDLEAIAAWGLKNMVKLNASETQYCTLSNKKCPSEHSVIMSNQALLRSQSFKLLGVSITENMIWHEHVSWIATAAGKKLGYLFRARKYFSPSNLLTLYKAQIRPSLEYCSHIWGAAAPTTLSILDAVQRRAIRLIAAAVLWYLGFAFAVCLVIKKRTFTTFMSDKSLLSWQRPVRTPTKRLRVSLPLVNSVAYKQTR